MSITAIKDFETGQRQPRKSTVAAIRRALESAGVLFIPGNGGGEGVRLKLHDEAVDDSAPKE